MSNPIVITRELVKRGWSDFEPKLITGLLSGSVAAFAVSLLTGSPLYFHLSPIQESAISVGCFFLGGYITPSAGTAVTKRIEAGVMEVEKHSGSTVTTVTAPTTVQKATATAATAAKIVETSPGSFTKVIEGTDVASSAEKPTEVLPPTYTRGQSIMEAIAQNGSRQA